MHSLPPKSFGGLSSVKLPNFLLMVILFQTLEENNGQDHQDFQHQASAVPRSNGNHAQPQQFELVGHSIVSLVFHLS